MLPCWLLILEREIYQFLFPGHAVPFSLPFPC